MLSFIVSEAFVDLRRAGRVGVSAILLITLSLTALGGFWLLSLNLGRAVGQWRDRVKVVVFLREEPSTAALADLTRRVEALDGVQRVRYVGLAGVAHALDAVERFDPAGEIREGGGRRFFPEENHHLDAVAPLADRAAEVQGQQPEAAERGERERDEQDGADADPARAPEIHECLADDEAQHVPLDIGALALVLDQYSVLEPDRAPLELGGQARLVGRQEDRRAPTPDVLDQVEDFARHLFVEVSRGLVGQQESRRPHDGPREGRPLPLTLGELRRVSLGARGEADGLERLEGSRRDITARSAEDPEDERDVLEDGPAGEELGVLEDDAERAPEQRHLPAAQGHDVEARDLDLAVRGALVRVEQA